MVDGIRKMKMSKETLYWTIGGVVLALLALYAATRNSAAGASSGGSSDSGAIVPASTLAAQVSTVNTNAAQVEETLLNDETQFAINSSNVKGAAFQTISNNATAQLQSIEQAATSRLNANDALAGAEFTANQNTLLGEFEATQQTSQNANNNQTALGLAGIQENIAHFESDNATTIARIQHGSSFGNFLNALVGSAGSIFSGLSGLGLKIGGGGGSSSAAPALSAPPPAPSYGSAISGGTLLA